MGRGSRNFTEPENKSAFTGTCVSESYFTREEVLRHNNRNDLWIIIDNKVYNVTEFQRNHPGGSKILKLYAGEDATEVFNAFHKDFDKINRYLKIYCIGNLNPNDLLNSETKLQSLNNRSADKIRELERLQKLKEMKKDLAVLRKTLEEMGLFNPSYTFFFLQAFHIVFFQVLGFYILWNYSYGILPLLSALICHVIAQAQAAWTQHDYGHSSIFKKPKHNQWVQTFFLGVIKGACAEWWTYLHNQHHAKPNVLDMDPDVRLSPVFVLGNTEPKKKAIRHASEKEKLFYNYSLQQYFFPLVAPLLFPVFFQITTIKYGINKKRYVELASVLLMFIIQFSITVPVFDSSWNMAIAYWLAIRILESSWFAWVSQSNHIPMDIHENDEYDSWLSLQLKATCNIEKSFFNDWFTGHLNFQIEHHLFPLMPRHNYYKAQPLVKALCRKHNIDYIVKPLGVAFADILFALKKYGEIWSETYNEFKI